MVLDGKGHCVHVASNQHPRYSETDPHRDTQTLPVESRFTESDYWISFRVIKASGERVIAAATVPRKPSRRNCQELVYYCHIDSVRGLDRCLHQYRMNRFLVDELHLVWESFDIVSSRFAQMISTPSLHYAIPINPRADLWSNLTQRFNRSGEQTSVGFGHMLRNHTFTEAGIQPSP